MTYTPPTAPASPPQRSMTRTLLMVGCGVIIACAVCGGVAFALTGGAIFAVFNTTVKPIVDATEGFMQAVKANDWNKAYGLVVAEQQAAFGGSGDGMKQLFQGNGWADPQSWTFNDFSFNSQNSLDAGRGSGTVTLKDGTQKPIVILFKKVGDIYKVEGVTIGNPQ